MVSIRWIRNKDGRLSAVWTARNDSELPRGVVASIIPVRNISNYSGDGCRSLQKAA
jgi:hypothetical protein